MRANRRRAALYLTVALVVLSGALGVLAQGVRSSLRGRVSDSASAILVGASVTAVDAAGAERTGGTPGWGAAGRGDRPARPSLGQRERHPRRRKRDGR